MPTLHIKDLKGGLNLQESSVLKDNQFESLVNMYYDADGRLRSRHGTKQFGASIGPNPITSSYFLDDQKNNIRTLLAFSGTSMYRYLEDSGSWISIKDNLTEFESDGITRTRFSFASLREVIYFCNGVDSYFKYDPTTDTLNTIGNTATGLVTFDSGTDVVNDPAHGLANGESIRFSSGVLPAELDRRYYYVRNQTTNSYQLSYFPTGDIINFTDDGSGTTTAFTSTQPRCRFLAFLADAIYGAGEDRNPSTLYFTNAVGATSSDANTLNANDLFVGGAESGRINCLEELQKGVLAFKDKKIFNVAADGSSALPTDAENGGYGNGAVAKVNNSLLYFNDRGFTTLKAKSGATSSTALQDKPLSDDVRALTSQVTPKNYNFTTGTYILPFTNYYGSFSTNGDDRPDTTLVYSALTEGWSQYRYPNHYGFTSYKDADGNWRYLMNSATSGQMIEMETGFDDVGGPIPVELETKSYDLGDETESDTMEAITIIGLKSPGDEISVDLISDGISIGGGVITDRYINTSKVAMSISDNPIGTEALGGGESLSKGVDLHKFYVRFPVYELVENLKIKMTSSSTSLVWTVDKFSLDYQNESRDLFTYANLG